MTSSNDPASRNTIIGIIAGVVLITVALPGYFAWEFYPRVRGTFRAEKNGVTTLFSPRTCRIALEKGAIGLTLTSSEDSLRVRLHDGTFDSSFPTHVELFQNENDPGTTLNKETCATFDFQTHWNAGNAYSDRINQASGSVRLDCTDERLGHVTGKIDIFACPLEKGTTID